jgi:hypothetical protein
MPEITANNKAPMPAPMITCRWNSLSSATGGGEGTSTIAGSVSIPVVVALTPEFVIAALMSAAEIAPEVSFSATAGSAAIMYGFPHTRGEIEELTKKIVSLKHQAQRLLQILV